MTKIYIIGIYTGNSSYGVIRDAGPDGDVMGYAYVKCENEDKIECICSHLSSGKGWFEHDMGLTNDYRRTIYEEMFPNGSILINLGVFKSGEEAYKVLVKNVLGIDV